MAAASVCAPLPAANPLGHARHMRLALSRRTYLSTAALRMTRLRVLKVCAAAAETSNGAVTIDDSVRARARNP
ncbi:hypothetical protein KSP40_PGU009080 [Platanthera guangdongensis]|uniref:Uncharacterized protein n=1 Tax=Platanthera guangdongensis TaxID=2320717 RepID=A0ABR2MLG5_9ASPA